MRRHGLDALVATTPLSITYFTDYHLWIDPMFKEYMMRPGASSERSQNYAVLPLDGEPALVVNPLLAENATDLWVRDVHGYGDAGLDTSLPPTSESDLDRRMQDMLEKSKTASTPTEALVGILKARGLADARVGLEMEGLPAHLIDGIRQTLPQATVVDCTNLIRLVRMVKSVEELSRLVRAAEIAEHAAVASLNDARVGVSMAEIAQQYRIRLAEGGADVDHFAYGLGGWGIATESSCVLADGEFRYVDYGCIYKYYFSDSGMTLAMQDLIPEMADRYSALRECMNAGIETIRPGVKASTVQHAMQETLGRHGITASFPHGHGIGLEPRDYPIIVPDSKLSIRDDCVDEPSDLPLEANMVLNLEAPLFIGGVGSLHIEETFLVTPTGCRSLVEQNRDHPMVPTNA